MDPRKSYMFRFYLVFAFCCTAAITVTLFVLLGQKDVRVDTVEKQVVMKPQSYDEAVAAWGDPASVPPDQLGADGAKECGTWAFGGGKVQVFSCR